SLPDNARDVVNELLAALEAGNVRAADRDKDGNWRAVPWVKRGILLGFRVGQMTDMSVVGTRGDLGAMFGFFDKDTFPLRAFELNDGVRIVPGGSAIRRGAYVARG